MKDKTSFLPMADLQDLNRAWQNTFEFREEEGKQHVLFGFLLGKGVNGAVAYQLAYNLDFFDMMLP